MDLQSMIRPSFFQAPMLDVAKARKYIWNRSWLSLKQLGTTIIISKKEWKGKWN